jgi:hypothetical protein
VNTKYKKAQELRFEHSEAPEPEKTEAASKEV